MNDKYVLKPLAEENRKEVMDIFNYYIENSFAAFPETKLGYEFFDFFLNMTKGYPAVTVQTENGNIIGFGFLRAYHPLPVFRATAEISYFIKPEYTGKQIGKIVLDHLISEARKINLRNILATITATNRASLRFHLKNGFAECGRIQKAGRKKETDFGLVLMQKLL